jgi:hypothetical protein
VTGVELWRLTDDALCRAWRSSTRDLRSVAADELLRLVQRREGLLDEMERRHRYGVLAWEVSPTRADDQLEDYFVP